MSDSVLLNVKEHDDFLGDSRDVQAVLIHARRFAKDGADANTPFATHREASEAADEIKSLKSIVKTANDHRLGITAPYRDTVAATNAEYAELLSPAEAAIEVLTRRTLAFKRQQDQLAEEEERRRREELQKREEEAAARAAEAAGKAAEERENAEAQEAAARARQEAAQAAAATARREGGADAKPKQIRGSFGSLGSVTDYKWDVYDLAALPDEHKTFNKKSLDAAVKAEKALAKAQGREFNLQLIDGVRIWPQERGVSR